MHIQWRNSTERYGTVAQVLHWTIFVLVAFQFASAWLVDTFPRASAERAMVINLHESLGLAALTLVAIRVLWRVVNPALPGAGPPWQRRVARAVHAGLYVLMVAVPVAGYVTALARGHDLAWFGIALPPLLGADRALSRTAIRVHEFLAWTLLALVGIHVAAALWHHVVARDATLRRMLPRPTGIELGWRR
jgi:cytochrome b561